MDAKFLSGPLLKTKKIQNVRTPRTKIRPTTFRPKWRLTKWRSTWIDGNSVDTIPAIARADWQRYSLQGRKTKWLYDPL
jgi:hypothetical protein